MASSNIVQSPYPEPNQKRHATPWNKTFSYFSFDPFSSETDSLSLSAPTIPKFTVSPTNDKFMAINKNGPNTESDLNHKMDNDRLFDEKTLQDQSPKVQLPNKRSSKDRSSEERVLNGRQSRDRPSKDRLQNSKSSKDKPSKNRQSKGKSSKDKSPKDKSSKHRSSNHRSPKNRSSKDGQSKNETSKAKSADEQPSLLFIKKIQVLPL